jgi:hypothetical protein
VKCSISIASFYSKLYLIGSPPFYNNLTSIFIKLSFMTSLRSYKVLVTNGILIIAETTKSLKGRLSNLRDEIQKQGFDICSDEERGDFTFIEAREL